MFVISYLTEQPRHVSKILIPSGRTAGMLNVKHREGHSDERPVLNSRVLPSFWRKQLEPCFCCRHNSDVLFAF